MRLFVGLSFAAILTGCAPQVVTPRVTNTTNEIEVARQVFAAIQPVSLRENVEYCGAIGFDRSGRLIASSATRGKVNTCLSRGSSQIVTVTASYHTHGGFAPEYFNEIPSLEDVRGDLAEGIDGYVATPGGRIWFVDSSARRIMQICGLGCLPQAANFIAGSDGPIEQTYTFTELAQKING